MSDEFYVGYLPLPKGFKRFLLALLPVMILGAIVIAAVATSQQADPGDGLWDLSQPVTLTGVLRDEPYAMLSVPPQGDQPGRELLLVTMGKVGGDGLSLPAGGPITVKGYVIGRGEDATLLTVENPAGDVTPTEGGGPIPSAQPLGPATLAGQIIDPKCYFGAMKPGEGKVHKSCATLCIAGGIPPMFMTENADGQRTHYLLVDPQGNGITGDALDTLLPYVADPVRIAGRVERWGDLLVFKIDVAGIERL